MIKDYLDEKLHEECGVFGVYRRDADLDVVGTTYYGLYALQHRGQESCGMAVNDDGVFYKRRELGLVNDVFTKDVLETDVYKRQDLCFLRAGRRHAADAQRRPGDDAARRSAHTAGAVA